MTVNKLYVKNKDLTPRIFFSIIDIYENLPKNIRDFKEVSFKVKLIKEFFDFSALFTSKKLKNIINSNNREHDLKEFAKEIGAASPLPISNTTAQNENKLITLIINTQRLAREENLWKLAFLSAVVSIISVTTTLYAVIFK